MTRLRCNNCGYSFESKVKGRTPNRCPYCGEFGKVIQEKSILDDLDKKED